MVADGYAGFGFTVMMTTFTLRYAAVDRHTVDYIRGRELVGSSSAIAILMKASRFAAQRSRP